MWIVEDAKVRGYRSIKIKNKDSSLKDK